jgi:hypothetical protein
LGKLIVGIYKEDEPSISKQRIQIQEKSRQQGHYEQR